MGEFLCPKLSFSTGQGYCDHDCRLQQIFKEICQGELNDLKCAPRTQEEIQQWVQKHSKFNILITGKPGTGKKTLVNGLKEYTTQETDHLEVHAMKVTSYKQIYDQVNFIVFDTGSSSDLEDMGQIQNSEHPDAIVFTLKMDDATLRQDDIEAIQSITKAFGWKVWKNAMFILTFANRISKPGHSIRSRENKVYFNKVKNNFALKVTETLKKVNVQSDVANRIAVIPVSLVTEPFIDSDGREVSWVEEFWEVLLMILEVPKQDPPKQDPLLKEKVSDQEDTTDSSPTESSRTLEDSVPDCSPPQWWDLIFIFSWPLFSAILSYTYSKPLCVGFGFTILLLHYFKLCLYCYLFFG